jgi:hypothetical protein
MIRLPPAGEVVALPPPPSSGPEHRERA